MLLNFNRRMFPNGECLKEIRGDSRNNFNDDEICMNAKEVIEIIKESNLWAPLTEKEKQVVIMHALKSAQISVREEDILYSVGEVYLELE